MIPDAPFHIRQMVAELLACCDPDPIRRRDHRIQKLASFPESEREAVKSVFNRAIEARRSQAA